MSVEGGYMIKLFGMSKTTLIKVRLEAILHGPPTATTDQDVAGVWSETRG